MSDQYNEYKHNDQPEGEFVEDFAANEQSDTAFTAGGTSEYPAGGEKFTPEKLGDAAIKFATETAYAAAGLANVLAEKAKEFYETQRKQIAANTPEGVDPNFRQFVDAMPDQFKTFMDEATKAYHDMAEKGRKSVTDLQAQVQAAKAEREAKPDHGAFDLKDDARATAEAETVVAPEPGVATEDVVVEDVVVDDAVTDAYPGESKDEQRF